MPIDTVSPSPYYLQANCAIQVRARHNGDTITFTESQKGTTPTASLLKAAPGYVALTVYDGQYHAWDMVYMTFNNSAIDNEDQMLDATKPSGADFNFYSLSADKQKQAIDARPYVAGNTVPLGISSGYAQDFIIKTDQVAVPAGGKLFLHDKLLK